MTAATAATAAAAAAAATAAPTLHLFLALGARWHCMRLNWDFPQQRPSSFPLKCIVGFQQPPSSCGCSNTGNFFSFFAKLDLLGSWLYPMQGGGELLVFSKWE